MFDKRSNHIAVHVSQDKYESAVKFYSETFGLKIEEKTPTRAYLHGQNYSLFVVNSSSPKVAQEFMVKDLDAAKKQLEAGGCKIMSWEGKGKSNAVQDPFGLVFNVWLEE